RQTRFISSCRIVARRKPSLTTGARLAPIEASIDEDSREPDFERPGVAIRTDVTECLDECILDGFVGIGDVAQILVSDPRRAALVGSNKTGESIARLGH